MSSNNGNAPSPLKMPLEYPHRSGELISIGELHHLVHRIDQSDIFELEVRSLENKGRLLLRKAPLLERDSSQVTGPSLPAEEPTENAQYILTAPRVGIFHPWSSVKERTPLAIGDKIEQGQHIGVIQALNVFNEIEADVTGTILQVLVENGQPVEYGQPLMMIAKQ